MTPILRTIELEFTILEFHENFVVSRVRENVVLSKKQVYDLIDACSGNYERKKFVYISKRIHNYNVDPTIYLSLKKEKNLAGVAIVSDKTSALNMAQFEKNFSKIPFEIFLDLEDAINWSHKILKNKKAGL
ncbi:MAG: hypothetical protein MUP24_04980 [Gillisia sp.]|nr:hypothetical protein [Gillisia sp.]